MTWMFMPLGGWKRHGTRMQTFQTLNNTLHTWSCLRYTLWFHVAHRWSRPSLILWASKHNWLPHHSEHHCSIKLDQIKLANDLKNSAQFQPDQHLFKFIKDFDPAHKQTLCWSRCFQITFKTRYYIVLDSSFLRKAQKSIQTSCATIHGLAKDGLLANMNHNFETKFRCALWEHGEKVTDKLCSDCRYETQQNWHKRQHTKKTLVEGLHNPPFYVPWSSFWQPKCGGDSPVKANIKLYLGNNMKHVKWTKQHTEPSLFLLHRRGGLHAESNWCKRTTRGMMTASIACKNACRGFSSGLSTSGPFVKPQIVASWPCSLIAFTDSLLWTKLLSKEKFHRICLGHLLQPESSSKASASKYPASLDNNHCHHSA
jgi:hypothetical protein